MRISRARTDERMNESLNNIFWGIANNPVSFRPTRSTVLCVVQHKYILVAATPIYRGKH